MTRREYIIWVLKHDRTRPFRHLWRWAKRQYTIRRFWSLKVFAYGKYKTALRRNRPRKAKFWLGKHRDYKKAWNAAKEAAAQTGCNTSSGDPHWGGAASIAEKEVVPVATRRGVPVTSRKRTDTLGNPSSDHYVGNTTAYAVDLGTYSGAATAHAIADALGIGGYSTGNYNSYYIRRCGHTFRVQILWAVSGHFNHIHVGIRLVG